MRAAGLPVPACDARQAMSNVGDLDIQRGGVEQVEPPPRQHPLPGAVGDMVRFARRHLALRRGLRSLPLQFSWQKQVTRWSLTMPVACMKAYTMVGPTNLKPRAPSSFGILIETRVQAGTLAG